MQTNPLSSFFDGSQLIQLIWNKKKEFFYIGLSAVILSATVSFLITPEYRSSVILFPAKQSTLSKALFANDVGTKQDLLEFGEEDDAEQMLQILYSDAILSKLNRKYNLLRHYDIDMDDPYRYTQLQQEFEDRVSYRRTEYQSIQIDVLDEFPDTAALVANSIAEYIDSVKNHMQKERALGAVAILKNEREKLENRILKMEDSLRYFSKKGVLDFEVQVEKYSEQLGIALNTGKKEAEKMLQNKLDTLAKYGASQVSLRELVLLERERLVKVIESYEETVVDANSTFPQKFIVNEAYPAEKKTYPVRWLIVTISTLSALLAGLVYYIWKDTQK